MRSLTLLSPPPNDSLTFAPNREGLTIDGWLSGTNPTLDGRALPFKEHDIGRSLAIAPGAKRFYLGSSYSLTAFDDAGTQKWRWQSPNETWAVNASKDGRIVVSADGDGAIRWHRAEDGRELLALQVLPSKGDPAKWDWVLWTPEGFYQATDGANNVLKWVTNHGPDKRGNDASRLGHRQAASTECSTPRSGSARNGACAWCRRHLAGKIRRSSRHRQREAARRGAARPGDRRRQIRRQRGRAQAQLRRRGRS